MNCQLILVRLRLALRFQIRVSCRSLPKLGMRRFPRHCREYRLSSILEDMDGEHAPVGSSDPPISAFAPTSGGASDSDGSTWSARAESPDSGMRRDYRCRVEGSADHRWGHQSRDAAEKSNPKRVLKEKPIDFFMIADRGPIGSAVMEQSFMPIGAWQY